MSAASLTSLPVEVKTRIVDLLDDPWDLQRLCMVHPALVDVCQSRIFASLEVARIPNRHLDMNASSTLRKISKHVRHLHIDYHYDAKVLLDGMEVGNAASAAERRNLFLAQLVTQLPRLRSLAVVLPNFDQSAHLSDFIASISNISCLRSLAVSLNTIQQQLRCLHIDFRNIGSDADDAAALWSLELLSMSDNSLTYRGSESLLLWLLYLAKHYPALRNAKICATCLRIPGATNSEQNIDDADASPFRIVCDSLENLVIQLVDDAKTISAWVDTIEMVMSLLQAAKLKSIAFLSPRDPAYMPTDLMQQ
ncbi:hypothetical protein EMMF5_005522 [Cystobasidiomycetes sp. EMM_F5]